MEKEIINLKNEIKELEKSLNDKINELKQRRLNLQNICKHNIVLKFDDKMPHKVGTIYTCTCPICDKVASFYLDRKIEESEFKNSKLIDLTKLDGEEACKLYNLIVNYILENYSYFYESDTNSFELEKSIYQFLKKEDAMENTPLVSFYYNKNAKHKSRHNLYKNYGKK